MQTTTLKSTFTGFQR